MKKKLSGFEKFAYGIGAVGKDMVYMLSASYVLYYFQDIMGVSAIAMGIILFAARIFDAFNDPIMGVLVAKTKSKWGKFRPWLFIGTLFNAIVLYCMFACPPSLNGGGLVAYAAITYILWGVTYTMMDIPYWSMVPAFTESGKERENLSALARSCAGVGSAIISIVTVMAVAFFGNTASAKATNVETYSIVSESTTVDLTVLEKDADGVATGEIKSFIADENINFDISAVPGTFAEHVYLNKDSSKENAKFELVVDGVEINNDNAYVTYAMDSLNDTKGVMAIYVDSDSFAKINNGAVSGSIKSTAEVERLGFKYFSLVIAILFMVFILITCLGIKEKSTVDVQTASVKDMFKALIQNDQAMAMVITIVLINTATYITSNLVIYFFKYDLAGKNWRGDYTLFNTFGGGIQILAMMILFPLLRKFFNNIKIFYICVGSAVVGYVILLVMALSGMTNVYPFLIPCFFIMAAVGILNVLVTVFLANTVDYGELKNGRRDESVIFSMQTFVVKLSSGIAALIAAICLEIFSITKESDVIEGSVVDFVNTNILNVKNHFVDTISNGSVMGLRMVMTLVPIAVLAVGFLVFKAKYFLNDNKLTEITKELNAKKNYVED